MGNIAPDTSSSLDPEISKILWDSLVKSDTLRPILKRILAAVGIALLLYVLNKQDESDMQEVEEIIDQVVAPGDRPLIKQLFNDEKMLEQLKLLVAA